jgi:hypothetical protein
MDEDSGTAGGEPAVVVYAKPAGLATIVPRVLDAVNLAGDAIGVVNPAAGLGIKTVAVLGGWLYEARKYDRVGETLEDVVERVKDLDAKAAVYVKAEEFTDFLEDALRKIADQPDPERRQALRAILLHVMERPNDHLKNIRFLRLANELPVEAWKVLAVIEQWSTRNHGDLIDGMEFILAREAGLDQEQFRETLDYLTREQVLDGRMLNHAPQRTGQAVFNYLLTRTGRQFLEYKRQ